MSHAIGTDRGCRAADAMLFAKRRLSRESSTYRSLKARHFFFGDASRSHLDLLALKYRTRLEPRSAFTALHMFVVTLRCDHSCHYCQVSRQTEDRQSFDTSVSHADKALDLVFRSPSPYLKVEFQGGEPLLNFALVRHIVERAEQRRMMYRRKQSPTVLMELLQRARNGMVHEGLQQASRGKLGSLELAALFERLKMALELAGRRHNASGKGSNFDLGALR